MGLLASMELGYPNGRIPLDNPILGRALWHYDDIIAVGNHFHAAIQTQILVHLLPRWNHDSDYRKAHVPRQTLRQRIKNTDSLPLFLTMSTQNTL